MSVAITGPPTTRVQDIVPCAARGDVVYCGQPLSFGTDVMRYIRKIGDVVVGRIAGIQRARWKWLLSCI
nr:unnamed protein product [Haemonchus contortus]